METQWGKQSHLATSRDDIREAHTILAYCLNDLLFSCVYSSVFLFSELQLQTPA